jgi:potassium voltage-gated channel Eag-related subfamily H protein 8
VAKYKKFKNNLTSELRAAKYAYFKTAFSECSDSSQIWKIINTKVLKKQHSVSQRLPTKLEMLSDTTKTLTSDLDIANEINSYFSNVGKTLAAKITPTDYISDTGNYPNSFEFQQTTKTEILLIIKALKLNKAAGLDSITSRLVKENSEVLATPLSTIINKSIATETIPTAMKIARVNPVYKKGSLNRCGNYRPISILPTFSKITEKVLNSQILGYLESNQILNKNQFGFRKIWERRMLFSLLLTKRLKLLMMVTAY